MVRRLPALLAAAAAAAALAAVPAGTAAAAPAATPTACSPAVVFGSLTFVPPSVPPGGTSNAVLSAANCTTTTQVVTETWTGRFLTDGSTGQPAGCPVIDPLLRTIAVPALTQVTTETGYLVFAGCTADRLRVTVTLSQAGVSLGSRSSDLLILQPAAGGPATPSQAHG
ncbi:MAG: hypothetical protein HOY69_22455 [Streptomyces sp.]|nr:hypothetical protein [Streptomyces sp.]